MRKVGHLLSKRSFEFSSANLSNATTTQYIFLDKAGIMMKAQDFIEMYDIVYIRLNYQGDFPSCANTLGAAVGTKLQYKSLYFFFISYQLKDL